MSSTSEQGNDETEFQTLWSLLERHWPEDMKEYLASPAAIQRADSYYREYVPLSGKVNLLVLSESPAFTAEELMALRMDDQLRNELFRDPTDHNNERSANREIPSGHLNLVHCLSYGEPWTIDENQREALLRQPRGKTLLRKVSCGTPTFWRILSTLAGDMDVASQDVQPPTIPCQTKATVPVSSMNRDQTPNPPPGPGDKLATDDPQAFLSSFSHVVGGGFKDENHRRRRLEEKRNVLRRIQDRGIVFADLCPLPIYTGGGKREVTNKTNGNVYWTPAKKIPDKSYKNIIQTAFDKYALPMIHRLSPSYVLLLGIQLDAALGGHCRIQSLLPDDCELLPTLNHPSDIKLCGIKYAPHLRILRYYASVCRYREDKNADVASQVEKHSNPHKPRTKSVVYDATEFNMYAIPPHPPFCQTEFMELASVAVKEGLGGPDTTTDCRSRGSPKVDTVLPTPVVNGRKKPKAEPLGHDVTEFNMHALHPPPFSRADFNVLADVAAEEGLGGPDA